MLRPSLKLVGVRHFNSFSLGSILGGLSLLDYLIKHEGLNVENVGKLNSLVKLLVNKGVHIKDYPLKMNDQHVGKLVENSLSLNVHCLVAGVTSETFNELSCSETFQAVIDGTLVFNLQSQVVELIVGLLNVATAFADSDCALLPSENILKKVLHGSLGKHVLDPAEGNAKEFLRILLNAHICRLTRVVLERETEFTGVVLHALRQFEEACHLDQLMQEVVVRQLVLKVHQVFLHTVLH